MKKIEFKNKVFKVIPEIRAVIAEKPEKTIYDDLKIVNVDFHIREVLRHAARWYIPYYSSPTDYDIIRATAYCDEKDEFDEKTGIDVASAKLELKNDEKIARHYDKLAKVLLKASTEACARGEFYEAKCKAIEDDLRKKYGRLEV